MLRNALSKRLPSLEACRPGWILTTGSLIITTVLWTAGRFPGGIPPGFWLWRGLSQLTVLWSVTLMAIAMLAVVRAHALEPVFGGLDRAVRFHKILGPSAILLLIAHIIFLALVEIEAGASIGNVFIRSGRNRRDRSISSSSICFCCSVALPDLLVRVPFTLF